MSTDSDFSPVVVAEPEATEPQILELPAADAAPVPTEAASAPVEVSRPKPRRPAWALPAAIAAVGLIASGSLGYLFYSTTSKLDSTRHQLAVTQSNLDQTRAQLSAATTDAASKKVVADYMKMYTDNAGQVRSDYGQFTTCDNYASCRFAAQQALTDLQAFQAARQSATVPSELSDSDSALGDSLSAAIAAVQELISAMDTDNKTKFDDAYGKLDSAMLSMAKAEASLGSELQ